MNNTKKIKSKEMNKKLLWNIVDNDFEEKKDPLECIYRKDGERTICDTCQFKLSFSD